MTERDAHVRLSDGGDDDDRFLGTLRRVWGRLEAARTLGIAGETAFWLFLSLIPLAAVTGLVAGRLSLTHVRAMDPLLDALPPPARTLVSGELENLGSLGESVSVLTIATFVWLASSGVHALFDALELQVGVTRSWLRKRGFAVLTCLGMPIVFAVLAFVGPGLTGLLRLLHLESGDGPTLVGTLVRYASSALFIVVYVTVLYLVGVPSKARKRMPIVPGALVATTLALLSGAAYGAYVSTVGDGSRYVAGLAVIGVTMIALYLFVTAILVGAVINRMLGDARALRDGEPPIGSATSPDARHVDVASR